MYFKPKVMTGITFEKDAKGNNRYIRFDLQRYEKDLRPLLKKLGIVIEEEKAPEGWEEALTPEEFLAESKKIIRKIFDERSKV